MRQRPKQPNSYFLAFLTAIMAGLFSTAASYFAASFQSRHAVEQKQFEFRAQAYSAFLEKVGHDRLVSELLNTDLLAEEVTTDDEIQSLENRMLQVLSRIDVQELHSVLSSDLAILRLGGSPTVQRFCDDILKTLILRAAEVNWSFYPPRLGRSYERWRVLQEESSPTYIAIQVSDEERLRFVMISKLHADLITQLRHELQCASP